MSRGGVNESLIERDGEAKKARGAREVGGVGRKGGEKRRRRGKEGCSG